MLLQARASSSLKVMAYKVTLKTPSGDQVIECADDVYILDAAEEAGKFFLCNCLFDRSRLSPVLTGHWLGHVATGGSSRHVVEKGGGCAPTETLRGVGVLCLGRDWSVDVVHAVMLHIW